MLNLVKFMYVLYIFYSAQYIAYGTFGIVADESIDKYELFVKDTFHSYHFLYTFTTKMNTKLKTVEFADTFQGIVCISYTL